MNKIQVSFLRDCQSITMQCERLIMKGGKAFLWIGTNLIDTFPASHLQEVQSIEQI